jgi:hypothetical protein
MLDERIPFLCKELRKEASGVKLKRIMRLDRGDRILMARKLESIINDLIRVQAVCDARCSDVIEAFEHLGGRIRTLDDTSYGGVKPPNPEGESQ